MLFYDKIPFKIKQAYNKIRTDKDLKINIEDTKVFQLVPQY